jgi:hypothetical protein
MEAELGGHGAAVKGEMPALALPRRKQWRARAHGMAEVQAELEVEAIDEWWRSGGAGRRRVGRRRCCGERSRSALLQLQRVSVRARRGAGDRGDGGGGGALPGGVKAGQRRRAASSLAHGRHAACAA